MSGLKTLCSGVAVGAAGVEQDRLDLAILDDLLGPKNRIRLGPVRGKDCGSSLERTLVHHQR